MTKRRIVQVRQGRHQWYEVQSWDSALSEWRTDEPSQTVSLEEARRTRRQMEMIDRFRVKHVVVIDPPDTDEVAV